MDDPRVSPLTHALTAPTSRRRVLRGLGGGLGLALLGGRPGFAPLPAAASEKIVPRKPGNPANRVLLPGDAGLVGFGLDFRLVGPPAVFFAGGDTPGWTSELGSAVGGFAFGYAATLATPHRASGTPRRAVQVAGHHGFPSTDDAGVAWMALTSVLVSGGARTAKTKVRDLDLAEAIEIRGVQTILATVAADWFDAIVVASRAGADLVTVAVADFDGNPPTLEEVVALAEEVAAKLKGKRHADESELGLAFAAQWTPGVTFAKGPAGLPFFSWATVLRGEPVPFTDDTPETIEFRRAQAPAVRFQSHVEGSLVAAGGLFPGHSLYYSTESSLFRTNGEAKAFHEGAGDRLRAGLPGITLDKVPAAGGDRRFAFELPSELGMLSGFSLQRRVRDGAFPQGLGVNLVAVPNAPETPPLSPAEVREVLGPLVAAMGDGVQGALVDPARAPLTVTV